MVASVPKSVDSHAGEVASAAEGEEAIDRLLAAMVAIKRQQRSLDEHPFARSDNGCAGDSATISYPIHSTTLGIADDASTDTPNTSPDTDAELHPDVASPNDN